MYALFDLYMTVLDALGLDPSHLIGFDWIYD